jgi:hypothetical protein
VSMSTWSALRGLTSPVDPSDPSAVNRGTRPARESGGRRDIRDDLADLG